LSSLDAARKAFKWKCEPQTAEDLKARDLARSNRVKEAIKEIKEKKLKTAAVEHFVIAGQTTDWDSLYKYAFDRLKEIRDNPDAPARTRFEAVNSLEKLADPAQDLNLIQRYVDIVWDGFTAHCPCCHKDYPLRNVKNERLIEYRIDNPRIYDGKLDSMLDRRLYLVKHGERRKYPHEGQLKALAAAERHIVGTGAARGGKSFLLAMFGLMFFLIPGVEIWILARVYDEARKEFEYLQNFLKTMFYPVDKHMYEVYFDKKSGEASIKSKWESEIKIKSGKSQGSITGSELEGILVAEPAWVDGDLFEEVRARMSSRLGRIISLGTPKGFGGFLGRLVRMTSRDMRTGKKLPANARLVAGGCPWGQSIYQYSMAPEENPEYVTSEIETARSELTDREFAAEFEGRMVGDADAKFPFIRHRNLLKINKEWIRDARFVVGVDQGERNFAACLLGYDGKRVFVLDEYFDDTDTTIKANMIKINQSMGAIIRTLGGKSENWDFTIFDADPPIFGQLQEMEDENREWATEYTFRPKNVKEFSNWREETCLWANEMGKENDLIFNIDRADLLFEQLQEAMIRPVPDGSEKHSATKKGWIINDQWRGDHVPDAWLMAMWTVYNGNLIIPSQTLKPGDAFEESRRALQYQRLVREKDELSGFGHQDQHSTDDEMFEKVFGRPRGKPRMFTGVRGHYQDES